MRKAKAKNERDVDLNAVYVTIVGMNYGPDDKRVEAGEEVSDLPAESIPWLLEQGAIRLKEEAVEDVG
jgi:hypothetical protein